jgi:polyisoprenoid-binding protein YceI
MKKIILSLLIITLTFSAFSQKKTTTSAIIAFDATTTLDPLPKAENKTGVAALDTKTGTVQFEAAIKNFSFSNSRMQEHFNNAGWMNSDQFPASTFTGKITNLKSVNFSKNGTYNADVEGDLMIRGVTQKASSKATIVVDNGKLKCTAEFTINLDDYKITGNQIIAGKVSKEPKITVSAEF